MPDENQLISIESPFPDDAPPAEPEAPIVATSDDDEAIPEGTPVINGQPMITPSTLAAERRRVRDKAKEDAEKELGPLREKAARADALQQALDTVKPYVERLQKEQPQAQPQPVVTVTDEEAATYARRFQLYDKDSQLDTKTAKLIIAENRTQMEQVAHSAVERATAPLVQHTARERSATNFKRAAETIVGADGQLMADPNIVVELWKSLPPELTQNEDVAQIVMDAALGRSQRQKNKGRTVAPPSREPVLSEAPGGRVTHDVVLTDTGRKMGLTKEDLKDSAKTYNPGNVSPIGSW